jgi:hypothetical protein
MATVITCDKCTQPSLGKVTISIIAEGVVNAGQPTGVVLEADLCGTCRTQAIFDMQATALSSLEATIALGPQV